MKKFSLAFLFLVLSTILAHSQDSVLTQSRNRYANLDFGIGYLHTDLKSINSFLSTYGYRPVSEDIVTISFSPSFSVNRFVFRGEYTLQLPTTINQSDNSYATFAGRHVSASIG